MLSEYDLEMLRGLVAADRPVPAELVGRLLEDRDAWVGRAWAAAEARQH